MGIIYSVVILIKILILLALIALMLAHNAIYYLLAVKPVFLLELILQIAHALMVY